MSEKNVDGCLPCSICESGKWVVPFSNNTCRGLKDDYPGIAQEREVWYVGCGDNLDCFFSGLVIYADTEEEAITKWNEVTRKKNIEKAQKQEKIRKKWQEERGKSLPES